MDQIPLLLKCENEWAHIEYSLKMNLLYVTGTYIKESLESVSFILSIVWKLHFNNTQKLTKELNHTRKIRQTKRSYDRDRKHGLFERKNHTQMLSSSTDTWYIDKILQLKDRNYQQMEDTGDNVFQFSQNEMINAVKKNM